MPADLCPNPELLEAFLLGKVQGEMAKIIDQHLASCPSCLRAADNVHVEDEFTQAMKTARPVLLGQPEEVAAIVQHVKALRSEVETVQAGETFGHGQAEFQQALEEEDLSFLSPPEQPDEIGRLGEYRVLEVLGVGGMGIVFKAEDPTLRRLIALKVMRPAMAARRFAKDRFLREAASTAAIEHEHIVAIHRVGACGNLAFIAMQFLRGESLRARLQREGKFDQREVLRIGRQVADGLAAAHQSGLVHRDVKPDNIWLEEETGRVKILDFGLARAMDDDPGWTQSGIVLGTPRYMAPEQVLGEDLDPRCDLFSLGSVLYRLAAGKAPFGGNNLASALLAVSQANPPPLATLCPDLDPALSRLIMQLLSRDREQRPRSAAEVSLALQEIEKQRGAGSAKTATGSPDPAPSALWPARRTFFVIGGAAFLAFGCMLCVWIFGFPSRRQVEEHRQKSAGEPITSDEALSPGDLPFARDARTADREAAQWVWDLGGEVAIDTSTASGVFFRPPRALPDEPFSLTSIDLAQNPGVQDDDLKRLTGLRSLSMLNLSETAVGDEGIAHLTDLPELDYLNLVATQVTENGLPVIARLPQLTQLYLSRCPIHDAAAPYLREMNLSQLTVDGAEITFEGLTQLAGNNRLQSLTIAHLPLTSNEVQELSQLLPNCRIRSDHGTFGPQSQRK
jgi:serine/threonine protein kinase